MRRRRIAGSISGKTSQGGRGAGLENLINYTNELYQARDIAIIQKIPTPITPISMQGPIITKAFFSEKSTVDYIGVYRGIPLCFDAKESHKQTFPLKNIHPHQIRFMNEYEKHGGIAFLIIYYTESDQFYYMPVDELMEYVKRMENGGRKSIAYDELKQEHFFDSNDTVPVPYLKMINREEKRGITK